MLSGSSEMWFDERCRSESAAQPSSSCGTASSSLLDASRIRSFASRPISCSDGEREECSPSPSPIR